MVSGYWRNILRWDMCYVFKSFSFTFWASNLRTLNYFEYLHKAKSKESVLFIHIPSFLKSHLKRFSSTMYFFFFWYPCQNFSGGFYALVDLFLDSLFYSIYLYVWFCARIMQFFLLWLCVIFRISHGYTSLSVILFV